MSLDGLDKKQIRQAVQTLLENAFAPVLTKRQNLWGLTPELAERLARYKKETSGFTGLLELQPEQLDNFLREKGY